LPRLSQNTTKITFKLHKTTDSEEEAKRIVDMLVRRNKSAFHVEVRNLGNSQTALEVPKTTDKFAIYLQITQKPTKK
jgi:hypothetical protein